MFEHMTSRQAKEQILESVKAYYHAFHRQKPAYRRGDPVPYAGRVYDEQELCSLVYSTLEFWLTSGRYTQQFEKDLSAYLHVRYCAFVNSGSSANLLAFMALTSPLLGERAVRRGDEVITVAAGFPTTVSPIVQYGAVPVFVDISLADCNLDATMLEQAYSQRTKAVMAAHTLGNPFDLKAVKAFCDRHGLWLIEDNCDALGSVYRMDGQEKMTGTIGDIGTSSFYPAHHITTGEGGAVYTDHPLLYQIVCSLRDWGRDCTCPPGRDGCCGHRFDGQYGQLPAGYDHKYVYSHFGYNLKATDLQAAVGCAQLKKLPLFTQKRRQNFDRLKKALQPAADYFLLPEASENAEPDWFGFLLICREGVPRQDVVRYLESHGVQTRMLFAGNLVRHPCFAGLQAEGMGYHGDGLQAEGMGYHGGGLQAENAAYRIAGELVNTDRVMRDAFWVGVYPGMTTMQTDTVAELILEAVHTIRQ